VDSGGVCHAPTWNVPGELETALVLLMGLLVCFL